VRKPGVVSVYCREVTMIRYRKGPGRTIERWYVTLSFGGVHKKLAISKAVADWLTK